MDVPFSTSPPPKVAISAMGIPGWGHSGATWRKAGHYSMNMKKHHSPGITIPIGYVLGSPICSGIIIHCTFSSLLHAYGMQ